MNRPTILDARYNGLDSNTRLREYQRDLLIYEQAKETEKIANLNENKYNKDKNKEIEQLNKEIYLLRQKEIQDRKDDILNLYLDSLPEQEKIEYIKQKEINRVEEKRKKLLQYQIDDAYNKIYYTMENIQNYFDSNRKIHEKIENSIEKGKRIGHRINSIKKNLTTGITCILVFGGLFLGIYSCYNNNISGALALYMIILIFYTFILNLSKCVLKGKYKSIIIDIEEYKTIRDYDFNDYIKVKQLDRTEPQETQLKDYKSYCIEYLKTIKNKYLKNKNDFKKIDITLLDKVTLYISKIELSNIEDLIK